MAVTKQMARLAELNKERDALLATATQEAMSAVTEAINNLNSLGHQHTYELVEVKAKGLTRGAAACSVCGFKTNPPHTKRQHAKQGENPKPFTPAELKEEGLEKVA